MSTIPTHLYQLAPTNLQSWRKTRYDGGGFNASLADFAPEDAALLIRVYNTVKRVYDLWLYMATAPNYPLMAEQISKLVGSEQFITSTRSIGSATYQLTPASKSLRKVVHDIRGGAMSMLIGIASTLPERKDDTNAIMQAILTARDQAKLMRNALEDIDPIVRAADESLKVHHINEFVDKWQNVDFRIGRKVVRVSVQSSFDGYITNRCLETSAIDRILYNFANNATRFATDGQVQITILPTDLGLVRWVIHNKITPDHRRWLAENVGNDLSKLFKGGISSGGQGSGLSTCADFVSQAVGIGNHDLLLQRKYIGTKLDGLDFYAWYHWPSYQPKDDDEFCSCSD